MLAWRDIWEWTLLNFSYHVQTSLDINTSSDIKAAQTKFISTKHMYASPVNKATKESFQLQDKTSLLQE